jgi:glutamyl-tRNA reductase
MKPRRAWADERIENDAEIIRRREVSRVVSAKNLSPEEAEVVESMSRSLVDGLLRGPISAALGRAADRRTRVGRRLGR